MYSFSHFIREIDWFILNNFEDCLNKWIKGICAIHFRLKRQVAHKRNWMSCKKLQFIDKFTRFLISFFKLIHFKSFPSINFLDRFSLSPGIDWCLASSCSMSRPFSTSTHSWLSSYRNCIRLLLRSHRMKIDISIRSPY